LGPRRVNRSRSDTEPFQFRISPITSQCNKAS
jgi:hypothetical protein